MSRLTELALTPDEVAEILKHCGSQALLVGGQALGLWANYYQIAPVGVLAVEITSDVDFIGNTQVALALGNALSSRGWKYWQPTREDITPQTAKLTKTVRGLGIQQIDFLHSIVGLDTQEVQERAVSMKLANGTLLRVLHPLDVLESRLKNLAQLPAKRNPQGAAQAQLSVLVAQAYLLEVLHNSNKRSILRSIERVMDLAQDASLQGVFADYSLDLPVIVPAEQVPVESFRLKRWPQLMDLVLHQRKSHAALRERRAAYKG